MSECLRLLLGLSLSGTLMALLLILLRRLLGQRLPSAFYTWAWLLVLLRFLLPLPGLMPDWGRTASAPVVTASLVPQTQETAPARFYGTDSPRPGGIVVESAETVALPTAETESESVLPAAEKSDQSRTLTDLREVLHSPRFWFSLWLIGLAGSALWYGSGYLRFRRELRTTLKPATRADRAVYAQVTDEPCPALYRSKAVSTPMLLGLWKPLIVIPDRVYSDAMLQGILAHEVTHHRRHDVLLKWFAVLVSVVHWFNPLTRLFRSELDRCCELACDARLLRDMNADEKQLYGDMLLTMAAERRLPRSVVATSFAVEKQTLKERLVQIMTYKNYRRASLALILAMVLLLSACGAVAGPNFSLASGPVASAVTTGSGAGVGELTTAPELDAAFHEVRVSTVDEFLQAIAPRTAILLAPGVYDLSSASDYGTERDSGCYTWRDAYDGYELVIRDVEDLVIAGEPGESGAEILIEAVPRYANVLYFENCSQITLSAFTAGHTEEPGMCSGGVLAFSGCRDVDVVGCSLYGCGILGVYAENCRRLNVTATEIYDCSNGAVWAIGSQDVRVQGCDIHDCGKTFGMAFNLFQVYTSTGFAVVNTEIHDNTANNLLAQTSSDEVYLLGSEVTGNDFQQVFFFSNLSPVIDGCAFRDNTVESAWFASGQYARSLDGTKLGRGELEAMEQRSMEYAGPVIPQAAAVEGIPTQEGMEYHVSTVDEFLAAIGSDTTIYLEGELFNLSTAANLGGYGGDHYYWVDVYDGPGLVITGVENLRLIGQGKDKTTVEVEPRYADVLRFENCSNVTVADLTAGHTKGKPGSCSGDVLAFEFCDDFHVADCGLFGCGVFGIRSNNSVSGEILRTEIYECSGGAAWIYGSDGIHFTDCRVHDCVGTIFTEMSGASHMGNVGVISLNNSTDCSYNGSPLRNNDQTYVGEEELPEGDGSELSIRYYEMEPDSFRLRVGEPSVELSAYDRRSQETVPAEWYCSDESALAIEVTESGTCVITPLQAVSGGVELTAGCKGSYAAVIVYVDD